MRFTSSGILAVVAMVLLRMATGGSAFAQEKPVPGTSNEAKGKAFADGFFPLRSLVPPADEQGWYRSLRAIVWSPDGKVFATAGDDGFVRIWDMATRTMLRAVKDDVLCMNFSPDGKRLVTSGSDVWIKLWDVGSGTQINKFRTNSTNADVLFSPDGKTIAEVGDKVVLRDEATGKHRFERVVDEGGFGLQSLYAAAFSPNGSILATSGRDYTITLWSTDDLTLTKELKGHTDLILSLQFAPDGNTLVSGSADSTAKVWGVESGKELRSIDAYEKGVRDVAVSPDGTAIITGGHDGVIKFWDLATGQVLRTISDPRETFTSMALSPDGSTLVAASYQVFLWGMPGSGHVRALAHGESVRAMALSADGAVLATGVGSGDIRLWERASGKELMRLTGHADSVNGLAFSQDGKRLGSVSADQTARIWDTETGKELSALKGHEGVAAKLAFSPDGKTLATSALDKFIRTWDVATGKAGAVTFGDGAFVRALAYSADGKSVIAVTSDGSMKFYDSSSGKLQRTVDDADNSCAGGVFNADRTLFVSFGYGDSVRLRPTDPEGKVRQITSDGLDVSCLSLSVDGKKLCIGTRSGVIELRDFTTGKLERTFEAHQGCYDACFSPDGKTLITAGDANVHIWSVGD